MRKLALQIAVGLTILSPWAAQASPQTDLQTFQAYFKQKFPTVPFDQYGNGVYALPNATEMRAQWEQIMEFPPYDFELDRGKKLWNTPFKNGKTYASCFKNGGRNIAQHYPYWSPQTKQVVTIIMDINTCRSRNGAKPYKNLTTGKMADLDAYVKYMARGQKISINISSPGAIKAYDAGRAFFWARRGQLNFSCATCHVQNVGKHLRGNIIGPALGHNVSFPAYRSKWGTLGTIDKRYQGCNKKVRAQPLAAESVQYRDLEFYETYMDTGLPLSAPGQRP